MNKFVKLVYPLAEKSLVEVYTSRISFSQKETIYNIVDFFKEKIFLKFKLKKIRRKIKNNIQLSKIINLHDEDGVDVKKIRSMIKQIESGHDILSDCGLPNIKLIKTKNNELVLFDGHHSLLSYICADKKYLSEVPHLIVQSENNYFSDNELHVFFGKHLVKLKNKNWRDYVINWNVSEKKQFCKRKRNNIGELYNSLISELFRKNF